MPGKFTFTMIKPGAVENEHIGEILTLITNAGFRIAAMKLIVLRRQQAETFYRIHKNKPFFKDLIDWIISKPIVAAVLEKENAVVDYRKLMGATNPKDAEEGTIRKLYATSIQMNAVHGSDSEANAIREINFFFPKSEIYTKNGYCILNYAGDCLAPNKEDR